MPRDNEPNRILLVGNWPPPLGGVSVHVRQLRDQLESTGTLVTVLDVGQGRHRERGVVPAPSEATFLPTLAALIWRHDLVHLHTSGANRKSWLLIHAVSHTTATLHRRSIVTLHSGHGPEWLQSPLRALQARMALSTCAAVVCVNENISRHLQRLGIAVGRHHVLPAFGRNGLHPTPPDEPFRTYRQTHHPLLIAMVAPGPAYGADELIQAFARFRRSHPGSGLVLYGDGSEGPATESLCHRHRVEALRLGPVVHDRALGYLQASDMFIRATRVDGDSVSVREALALGTRVVATETGYRPPGVVTCPVGDIDGLTKAMDRALAMPPPSTAIQGPDGIDRLMELYAATMGDPQAATG